MPGMSKLRAASGHEIGLLPGGQLDERRPHRPPGGSWRKCAMVAFSAGIMGNRCSTARVAAISTC
jgi:hypothetical protein